MKKGAENRFNSSSILDMCFVRSSSSLTIMNRVSNNLIGINYGYTSSFWRRKCSHTEEVSRHCSVLVVVAPQIYERAGIVNDQVASHGLEMGWQMKDVGQFEKCRTEDCFF